MSRHLFRDDENLKNSELRETLSSLYEDLKYWHDKLPNGFDPEDAAPHILLLHIRYYTLLITMISCPKGSKSTHADQLEASCSDPFAGIAVSSARAIAGLVRIHQTKYGVSRSHIFALYAVNLALFVLLNHRSFDTSDPDFVSLALALHIIANRSNIGNSVFQIFKESLHGKVDGKKFKQSPLPDELKELLYEDYSSETEGGRSDEDDQLHDVGTASSQEGCGGGPGSEICEMLSRYESLTLGREEQVIQDLRETNFSY